MKLFQTLILELRSIITSNVNISNQSKNTKLNASRHRYTWKPFREKTTEKLLSLYIFLKNLQAPTYWRHQSPNYSFVGTNLQEHPPLLLSTNSARDTDLFEYEGTNLPYKICFPLLNLLLPQRIMENSSSYFQICCSKILPLRFLFFFFFLKIFNLNPCLISLI